jgi:hypothetical protein
MTTWAMRVEGEEPFGSKLERFGVQCLGTFLQRVWRVSMAMSYQEGPDGHCQKPVTREAPGSQVARPAPK